MKKRRRAHVASVAEGQRAARGTIEHVSIPWLRTRGRALVQVWIWISKIAGKVWRRLADSYRWPGRVFRRFLLLRITDTLSRWMVLWALAVAGFAILLFREPTSAPLKWAASWGLGGAAGAFLAVIWHDLIKSPHTIRIVRRRIVDEPEALLRATLAKQTTKIIELDPPVDTVSRDELYDELLPGALARKKDVQIVVGDPGAGKTTALVDLAAVLAKIGLMPVLLEMRSESRADELIDRAREQFEKLVQPYVKTSADGEIVWRWLCARRRVAILVDDIDQIGYDGEPGFVMRRLLENVATEGQAVIVTARPAGVPAGIAASAIPIEPLRFKTAVDLAAQPSSKREPGAVVSSPPQREEIERWVREGDLTEAPLYLEALAELTSVGACPDLPDNPERWGDAKRPGRWHEVSPDKRVWNPLWVRYMLLKCFYDGVVRAKVRPSLAIEPSDRRHSVEAIEGAALGTLGATGCEAVVAAAHSGNLSEAKDELPKRSRLVDFLSIDDRGGANTAKGESGGPRSAVSQHEAIDTCIRLRILEPDRSGEPQFRHRIMQAFLAGRCLAKIGRQESEDGGSGDEAEKSPEDLRVNSFDDWVDTLMDSRHPEKLTAHLSLTFAAIHADECALREKGASWDGLAGEIVTRLVEDVAETSVPVARAEDETPLARQVDPMQEAADPAERFDPDDDLIKLTTAANLVGLLRHSKDPEHGGAGQRGSTLLALLCARKVPVDPIDHREHITKLMRLTEGAMRWTKLQALPALSRLGGEAAWLTIWEHFTCDDDYDVRRVASGELDRHAWHAFPKLREPIEDHILCAGYRASKGDALKSEGSEDHSWSQKSFKVLEALGWVLPAIVSGLGEELREECGGQEELAEPESQNSLDGARKLLRMFATLAYEGGCPELEDSLAQGFKADGMCHASDPSRKFRGPGWVASNRRLAADIALPRAESWYARMLLYQALALYAITGANRDDTMDIFANRLHRTRERHPFARRAAKLARKAVRHARFKGSRWEAFVWSDDVEGSGRLPAVLSRGTAQLVGDVTVLVDLKEGSSSDQHERFGYMEELPHCLSTSRTRYEILGTGCPQRCGWGFCPYRAASPDEPDKHRGVSRGFSRGERRLAAKLGALSPPWQRRIRRRRMREFWEQMEFKARR